MIGEHLSRGRGLVLHTDRHSSPRTVLASRRRPTGESDSAGTRSEADPGEAAESGRSR